MSYVKREEFGDLYEFIVDLNQSEEDPITCLLRFQDYVANFLIKHKIDIEKIIEERWK
jgi:hypothetical protein